MRTRFCPLWVSEGVRAAALGFYRQAADDGHHHVHVFLKRSKAYLLAGRYQTEDEAREIDSGVKQMLVALKFPFVECDTDEQSLRDFLSRLEKSHKE